MALGRKTDEERGAEQARIQEQMQRQSARLDEIRAAAEQEAARKRHLESPIGQAEAARQRGDRFFQVSLTESEVKGTATDWTFSQSMTTTRVHGATNSARAGLIARDVV